MTENAQGLGDQMEPGTDEKLKTATDTQIKPITDDTGQKKFERRLAYFSVIISVVLSIIAFFFSWQANNISQNMYAIEKQSKLPMLTVTLTSESSDNESLKTEYLNIYNGGGPLCEPYIEVHQIITVYPYYPRDESDNDLFGGSFHFDASAVDYLPNNYHDFAWGLYNSPPQNIWEHIELFSSKVGDEARFLWHRALAVLHGQSHDYYHTHADSDVQQSRILVLELGKYFDGGEITGNTQGLITKKYTEGNRTKLEKLLHDFATASQSDSSDLRCEAKLQCFVHISYKDFIGEPQFKFLAVTRGGATSMDLAEYATQLGRYSYPQLLLFEQYGVNPENITGQDLWRAYKDIATTGKK